MFQFRRLRINEWHYTSGIHTQSTCKWEHWMIRWMEAYRVGLTAKDAQFQKLQFKAV
ncbi:hypothetical protein BYT27DRAFT_7196436 [Phlegmacium glaucopus]|nr:hypothetical protein BYT27DRAFT_7196436 [Phlegmacium glaucopus]